MNTAIVNLEQNIIDIINNAEVPIAATYLILDKITKEVKVALNKVLEQEKQMQEQQLQEQQSE